MGIFRPTSSVTGGNKFYGTCESGVVGFTDRVNDFDWADVFIEIEIQQKGSDYTKKMQVCGSLERDARWFSFK